jgi:hypothetical protein
MTTPESAAWAAQTRWAIEGDTLYILDLRRDAYMSLPIASWQRQWPELRTRGLIANADSVTSPVASRAPKQSGVLAFWSACLWARNALRRSRLEPAANALRDVNSEADIRADELIAQYRAWRPLYPRAASCLFDSLALGRFLLLAGIHCELVFGVRGGPFAAHAWLEKGGVIINDEPDYCAGFVSMQRP